jgi:Domain of unknown function (DUF4129)
LLRAELLRKEYHDQHLWQRLLAWLGRLFDRTVGAASGSSPATAFVTMLLAVLLVVGLTLLLARVRRDRRMRPTREIPVLPDRPPSASSLRRSAEEALAEDRYDDALLDAFRALTARQLEHGALEDQPGLTAQEVSLRLAGSRPPLAGALAHGADLFDATLYGHRPATRDEAVTVLALDDTLVGVR